MAARELGVIGVPPRRSRGDERPTSRTLLLPDGQRGYIFGDTKILRFRRVLLKAEKVPLRREPDLDAPVTATLAKGSVAEIVETVVDRGGKQWNKLRTPAGVVGYVEAVTLVAIVPDASRSFGRKYLLVGAGWMVAAVALVLVGAAMGLRRSGMELMACVPVVQVLRFGYLGAWHLRNARV